MLVPTMPDQPEQPAYQQSSNWREALRRIEEARVSNARELDLSGLKLEAVSESIAELSNLESLYLVNNRITAIPESIARLRNLVVLDLRNNLISLIPGFLSQLSNLRVLDLHGNHVTAIPESIATLKKLSGLYLHRNPGLEIPAEILGPLNHPRLAKDILAYYFAQRADSRPLNEAKLILVGQGGVGKTSLVKTLTTGKGRRSTTSSPPDWLVGTLNTDYLRFI